MTHRNVRTVIAAAALTCGLIALAPAMGWAQQAHTNMPPSIAGLPQEGGPITMFGCFLRLDLADGKKFVLTNPTVGPATSVPEATCSSSGDEPMVELDDVHNNLHKHHLDRSQVGRWIEVTGRLEKAGHQDLREVHVNTYRVVPVEVPRAAVVFPPKLPTWIEPPPPAQQAEAAEPAPVATSGVREELPKTASYLPLTGLIGLLALGAGLALPRTRR